MNEVLNIVRSFLTLKLPEFILPDSTGFYAPVIQYFFLLAEGQSHHSLGQRPRNRCVANLLAESHVTIQR